jgi:nitrous oxidase accessory protein NosD
MFLARVFSWLTKKRHRPTNNLVPRRTRLGIEMLEGRLTPSTLVVDNNLNDHALYTTIQEAVNAAHANDTIVVEPGTYSGQVVIGAGLSHLTLTSAPCSSDPTIQAPSTLTGLGILVEVSGSTHVTINDFNIVGNNSTEYGIRVDNGGSAIISNNNISNILGGNGAGIVVGESLYSTTGSAVVINNQVSNYVKAGIVVDNTGSSAAIAGNTVAGVGTTGAQVQYGIQVSFGASADVECNDVSGNSVSTGSADSAGILVFQAACDVSVQGNCVHDNEFGVFVVSTNGVEVAANSAFNNSNDGIQLLYSSNSCITFNISADNGGDGISVYGNPGAANNNVIAFNIIADNTGNGVTLEDSNGDKVHDNLIFDNGGSGVYLNTTQGVKVAFNVIDHDDGTVAISRTDASSTVIIGNLITN